MRMLLVTPDFPPASGGIQLLLARLVQSCVHSEFDIVTLASPRTGNHDASFPAHVTRVPASGGRRLAILRLNAAAVRQAKRVAPDAVVSGHIVTGPASLYLQWKWDVPAIQYTYAKELGRRTRVAKLALAHSSRTIAISTYTRERVLQLGAASDRVRLILPGVDPPARQGAVTCLAEREPIVITVARLVDRYKGFDTILRALPGIRERVPNVRWVVVGEGPLRAELEQQARDLEVAHAVSFVGAVDDDERDRLLDTAAVFAMPSRLDPSHTGGEGFGLVYLEAAARGLPTVAGNVGGATDAVVHDETGLLVDPTDPNAVGRAISDLLVDRDRAEHLGQAARTYAGTLTWERMGRAFECVVAEAIASR